VLPPLLPVLPVLPPEDDVPLLPVCVELLVPLEPAVAVLEAVELPAVDPLLVPAAVDEDEDEDELLQPAANSAASVRLRSFLRMGRAPPAPCAGW
jgi:hypothetical protein